jgi:hypothetical protein
MWPPYLGPCKKSHKRGVFLQKETCRWSHWSALWRYWPDVFPDAALAGSVRHGLVFLSLSNAESWHNRGGLQPLIDSNCMQLALDSCRLVILFSCSNILHIFTFPMHKLLHTENHLLNSIVEEKLYSLKQQPWSKRLHKKTTCHIFFWAKQAIILHERTSNIKEHEQGRTEPRVSVTALTQGFSNDTAENHTQPLVAYKHV